MSMNITRLTISMPTYLYQRVKSRTKNNNVSRYISQAVEDEIIRTGMAVPTNPIMDFIQLSNKLLKIPKSKIIMAINKGRQ